MMLRYWYLLRSSWPRLLDLVYWPTVQMITWGFLQYYIMQNAGFFARAGGTFIGAVLLWDILFRGQLGFSISFMEEMWARNIGNLMMSPLRPLEFISALMVMSIVRLAVGAVPVTVLAIAILRLQPLRPRLCTGSVLSQPDADGLGGRDFRVRPGAEKRTWRGKSSPGRSCFCSAADLRLLPGDDAADLASAGVVAIAADIRVSKACVRY